MTIPLVRPILRAVANGREGDRLRMTLVATPEPRLPNQMGPPTADWFPLDQWPQRMAGFMGKQTHVWLRPAPADGPCTDWRELPITHLPLRAISHDLLEPMNTAWAASIGDEWDLLGADIRQSVDAKTHQTDLDDYRPAEPLPADDQFDGQGAIMSTSFRTGNTANIKGVIPIEHAAAAADIRRERADRITAKLTGGARIHADDEEERARAKKQPNVQPVKATDLVYDTKIKQAHYARYLVAVAATQDARRQTKQQHLHVKDLLGGNAGTAVQTAPTDARAGHTYGTWLQRSTQRPQGSEPTPTVPVANPGDRARTVYYAIQGDPLLSRLFCLSIDVEVTLGSDWPGDPTPRLLYLSAEAPCVMSGAGDAPLPLVVTAARLAPQAFWPFSIFDSGLKPVGRPIENPGEGAVDPTDYIEQQDGVWRFGGSVPGLSGERYDLGSLDVRRALAATSEDRDRGEQHATGGLTLFDRGRAFQVARDLALTELHAAKLKLKPQTDRPLVILHAEELTIGRRVDVAAVPAGTVRKGIAWRSLMQRFVSFEFDEHRLERVLQILLPSPRVGDRYLEESSFQVAARLVPHVGGEAGNCDVLTEEVIYVWDGTPAAVLTNPGTLAREPFPLPFVRTYALPMAGQDRTPRPPPLRYGAPYVLGMRAVFLGGGGPSLAEAALARGALEDRMAPRAVGAMPAPHRFLRHEGIAAPTLLFPDHLATRSDPQMGYEALDQAIVRSHTTPPPGHALTPSKDEPVEPLTPASARAVPRTTMRVFVAPEAPHDTLVRHGVLDGPNSAVVRQGGLLDVAFLPRLPALPGVKRREGFPVVSTIRLPALGEQAIYGRADAKTPDHPGSPVFRPLDKPAARASLTGYFPDPAAHAFCIRARYRGADRYLADHHDARLYDAQSAYPNALPLVVSVVRVAGLRTLQPVSITELAAAPAITRMDRKGNLQAKAGIRVTHLELRLMEGEDFDLEVACLPSEDMLAQCFAVADTLATRPEPDAVSADALVRSMANCWPIEEIAAVTQLRVCHAIACPTVLPMWGTIAAERTVDDAVQLTGTICLDLEQVDGFRIVALTAAATGGPIDDRSRTRSLPARRRGRWPTAIDSHGRRAPIPISSVLGFDLDEAGRLVPAEATVTLLEVGNLPVHGAIGALDRLPAPGTPALFRPGGGRVTEIDLATLHTAALSNTTLRQFIAPAAGATADPVADPRRRQIKTAQPAALVSPIAHAMTLSLIVQSRSASALETAPFYVDGTERALHRRTPLRPHEQSVVSAPLRVTVPATRRPAACVPRRPEPSFHLRRMAEACGGGTRHAVERTAKVRLWFARGLFSSGAGERVGIVLWPPEYFDGRDGDFERDLMTVDGREMTLSSFEDADLGPGGSFVSRWGGDPIREDAAKQSGFFIPPGAFAEFGKCCCATAPCCCPAASPHRPAKVGRALMPVSRSKTDRDEKSDDAAVGILPVSLLTYEPCFDLDRQEWFIDVDLRPGQAAEPFVRFGLVAYQPDAPEDMRLSRPVTVTASLLPARHVSFQLTDWKLQVTMTGLGSIGVKDLNVEGALPGDPAAVAAFETLKLPVAKLFLFHEQRTDDVVLRTPLLSQNPEFSASVARKQLEWTTKVIDLPSEQIVRLGPGMLVGYVEEVDRRMRASYPAEPISLKQMFSEENFVDSGPRFSARVPFRSV